MKQSSRAFALLLPLLLIISCSQSRRTSTQTSLDAAIANYIAGRHATARDQLWRLSKTLQGEDRCRAYLYLGRSHLSLGELEQAAEIFNRGAITCNDELFGYYLQQVRNRMMSSPDVLVSAESITRAQFACLLLHYFGSAAGAGETAVTVPTDIETHWAHEAIVTALEKGLLEVMPDGGFYPDEPVKRAAFIYRTGCMIRRFASGLSTDLAGEFPAGVEEKIEYFAGIAGERDKPEIISGRDAVNLLENISRKIAGTDAD